MNCRFCGNFVPEGKDSCPVCGRRPDEEPIGKLLSENQPGTSMQVVEENNSSAEKKNKKHAKGLLLPLILIAISVAGWFYGLMGEGQVFKTMLTVAAGGGTSLAPDSSFEVPGATSPEMTAVLIYAALAILLTVIGIVGIIMFFSRLINRFKYKD